MTQPNTNQISALQDCDTTVLKGRWRALTGRALPSHLPRSFVLRLLAYRIQADEFGDLDANTARILGRIARQHRDQPSKGKLTLESLGLSSRGERTLSPGTVLVREHDGVNHNVMVLEEGFAWNGTTYRSLSEVARAITGTRWNGRRFFGLTNPKCTTKSA
ncbi:MAG: DUF2924 domain-containing protein [Hyphomicrobiaceae bacterium]